MRLVKQARMESTNSEIDFTYKILLPAVIRLD